MLWSPCHRRGKCPVNSSLVTPAHLLGCNAAKGKTEKTRVHSSMFFKWSCYYYYYYILLSVWACVYESAYMCMCTRIGCHMNHGVCCLILLSAVSLPHSSVRSSPMRRLIAVTIVTLCAFLKPARSLVSPADSFLHAWPAVCREATCTLSQNGPVKKGFPVHYQKHGAPRGDTHAHTHTQ